MRIIRPYSGEASDIRNGVVCLGGSFRNRTICLEASDIGYVQTVATVHGE